MSTLCGSNTEAKNTAYGTSFPVQVENIVMDTEPERFLNIGLLREFTIFLDAKYLRAKELKQNITLFSKDCF